MYGAHTIAPLAMMGIILGIMPSLDAHWWALQLCRLASRKLLVCAYSFDLPELTDALRRAVHRYAGRRSCVLEQRLSLG